MFQYLKNVSRESIIIGLLTVVILGSAIDLYTDLVQGATSQHVVKEALVVILSLAAMVWLLASIRKQALELVQLKQDFQRIKSGQGRAGRQATMCWRGGVNWVGWFPASLLNGA